jgi:hypothetical protein
MSALRFGDPASPPSVSLLGFGSKHRGTHLLRNTLVTWLSCWWGFQIQAAGDIPGDILLLNGDDLSLVEAATQRRDTSRPFVGLLTSRGNPQILKIACDHERIGGFCRIVYKPGGPSRLHSVMKLCLHALKTGRSSRSSPVASQNEAEDILETPTRDMEAGGATTISFSRRNSAGTDGRMKPQEPRPRMIRSSTAHPLAPAWTTLRSSLESDKSGESSDSGSVDGSVSDVATAHSTGETVPTIAFGANGTLLQSSVGTIDAQRRFRVLVVEDNTILRGLLYVGLSLLLLFQLCLHMSTQSQMAPEKGASSRLSRLYNQWSFD